MMEKAVRTQNDLTERSNRGEGTSAEPTDFVIHWVTGSAYGECQALRSAKLRIGRGPDCHLRLEHSSVSRQHAELYRQGPIYALKDLGSTNGTYLNGRRTDHAAIADGDLIRVGNFLGIIGVIRRGSETAQFGELAPGLFGGTRLATALATARAAATTDIPIALVGETGTGKERVARALHHWSGRKGRFHALNCSAIAGSLAEAELFGHERGAFTGAERARLGHIRAAHNGTLFLDEISELSLAVQVKLLRAIEEREVVPLGATDAIAVDARILVACHEPLERLVERKTFRADLYARLAGFQVKLPALRSRRQEIPGLFYHFIEKHGRAGAPESDIKLVERLCLHDWPGNVRELELFARKMLALHQNEPVLLHDFANAALGDAMNESTDARSVSDRFQNRKEHDLQRLNSALVKHQGNMTAAAASVGISRRRAYRLLESNGDTNKRSSPTSSREPQRMEAIDADG